MVPKSDIEDTIGSPKFNFNTTKWENVLQSLRGTFFVERGMYDEVWQMLGALEQMVAPVVAKKIVKKYLSVV